MNLHIKIKRVHPRAQLPTLGSERSNCFDIRAVLDGPAVTIPPGGQGLFDTGLIFQCPDGWSMDVHSRSGMGIKHRVRLSNCTGIIDEDFRGTLKVALHNDSPEPYTVSDGDRICQARLVESHRYSFEFVDELDTTERGAGGLGSTGAGAQDGAAALSRARRALAFEAQKEDTTGPA